MLPFLSWHPDLSEDLASLELDLEDSELSDSPATICQKFGVGVRHKTISGN